MHGKDGEASERMFCAGIAGEENADIRITGAGGADNVGIQLARVEGDMAVLHPIAAVESEVFLGGDADLKFGRMQFGMSLLDDGYQFLCEKGWVMNWFVGVFSKFGDGGLVEIIIANIIEERASVAVRGANHDVGNGDASFLTGLGASIGGDVERNADEIAEDHGNFLVTLAEENRFCFERIVCAGGETFVKIAGHAHTGRRCDVNLSGAHLNRVGSSDEIPGEIESDEEEDDPRESEAARETFHQLLTKRCGSGKPGQDKSTVKGPGQRGEKDCVYSVRVTGC